MKKLVVACFALAAGLFIATADLRADTPPQLGEVVVSGQSLEETLPEELAQYGTRVDTVTATQVRDRGYTDVAQSLETLAPGLYISPKNGPFDYVDISLLGSRTQDVLWLLDGVRLNNRLYGGTTPLDTFPSSLVERLEILDGPQSLFYGTQAIAGAVNIVTRAFSATPDGALALGGDSNGGRHLDVYFRDGLGRHRFVIYGSADESNGYQPFRAQDYQPSATDRRRGYDVLTLGGKYSYEVRNDLRVSAFAQHTDGTLDFAQPFLTATAFNQRDEDILTAKIDYAPSDRLQFFAKGYAHWWRSHYTEFDNVVGMPGTLSVVDDHDFWGYRDYGANAVAKVSVGRWCDAFAGYDFQTYGGNDAVLVIADKREQVHGFFAQVRSPEAWQRLRVAAGARYNAPSFGPGAAVWNATAQFNVSPSLFVRGTAASAFRLPTAEELFADDPNDERGNPDLKPERSLNLNLSVGGNLGIARLPRLTWEAVGFARNVTDLISASGFDATTNQSLFENVPGTIRVRGALLVVAGDIATSWSASASYTYSSAQNDAGLQIDRVPRHQGKAWLDFHPVRWPIGLGASVNYAGRIFRTFGDTDRESYGNRAIVDLDGRVFLDGARRHVITVRVANLLGTTYATSLGKATSDADGSAYTYWNLGLPRTFAARYGYRF